jgi:2-hydroxychromene-2-carboxylate isomerase
LDVHEALFAARHDHARDLRDREVVIDVLNSSGVDGAAVMEKLADGSIRSEVRKRHESAVNEYQVFGVPTFITQEKAAFVRLMDRPNGDADLARRTIDRLLDLIGGHPQINEVKHTTVPL